MPKKIILRDELLSVLDKVKPGLSNDEIIEQSTHFIFEKNSIRTYNDDIAIFQEIKTGLMGAVKASEFYNLIKKMVDKEIGINQTDDAFVITGETLKASIKIDKEIKIVKIKRPADKSSDWKDLPSDFNTAIELGLFSVSKNMNIPELSCLNISGKYVFSSDSYRATKQKMKASFDGSFLLPAISAKELKGYDICKVAISADGWLHFSNKDKTFFSCRTYSGKPYPSAIDDFFVVKGKKIKLPSSFGEMVDRVSSLVIADFDLDRVVDLKIGEGKIVCTGKGKHGSVSDEIKVNYKGKGIDVRAHPGFLVEVLGKSTSMVIGDRLLFTGKGFEHALCLSS